MTCRKGCCATYREHVASIAVAPSATPTRSNAKYELDRERRFDRDGAAYKRLRADGLQPARVDGSAAVERHARTETDVERFDGRHLP